MSVSDITATNLTLSRSAGADFVDKKPKTRNKIMTNYTKKNSEENVQKRQQGIIWVEVNMSNPNGNGNDGRPRQLPDGRGTIHPVCFKAKMRTAIQDQESLTFAHIMAKAGISEKDFDRYRIMESKNRGFGHDIDASKAVKQLLALSDEEIQDHYWDHRIFGSTLLENNEDKSTKGEVPSNHPYWMCDHDPPRFGCPNPHR